jgi:RNA polymerase sigma factor (TIGR02999 family)
MERNDECAPPPEPDRARDLIHGARAGDTIAMNELVSLIYPELRRRARRLMSQQRRGHTFGETGGELIDRLFERMAKSGNVVLNSVEDQEGLIGVLTWQMRNILVDHARARGAAKRPGPRFRSDIEKAGEIAAPRIHIDTVLSVDEALVVLAKRFPKAAKAVELRYFGDLPNAEAAAAMGLSLASFRRELKQGVVFLKMRLGDWGSGIQ